MASETTIAVSRDTQVRLRKFAGIIASRIGETVTLNDALSRLLDAAERSNSSASDVETPVPRNWQNP